MNSHPNYFLVEVDLNGKIKEICINTFLDIDVEINIEFKKLLCVEDYDRLEQHLHEVARRSPMMGDVYNLITGEKCFVIMLKNGTVKALCIKTDVQVIDFLGHVAETCNYQVKSVLELYKKLTNEDTETAFLEDIMVLNNELINTKRDLATKNNELQKLNDDLQKINFTDFLTGTHNRRKFFVDVYDKLFKYDLYLIMMDFNNFKIVNDKYGHAKGDEMLQFFTTYVRRKILDTKGELYRLGGDEFAILIPTSCNLNVETLFKNIDQELRQFDQQVSMAYGVVEITSITNNRNVKIEEYMRKADLLMYEMKLEFYRRNGISNPRINKRK